MMENPFLADSEYNPVRPDDSGTVLDLKTNLDEFAVACARSADRCAGIAHQIPGFREMAAYFAQDASRLRIRQIALLAAYYIEDELRKDDGQHHVIQNLLAQLEANTCNLACDELRELVAEFLKGQTA